jgi:demethylmenaquinone methyltransferase/2-methoxy-6-polyprenyl-1,4-benzoquinol methylase
MSQSISRQIASAHGKMAFNVWMFSIAASRYDLGTRCLSLGQDACWKRQLLELLPRSDELLSFLDLACGTGDVALLIKERYPNSWVQGVDLSADMLLKARLKPKANQVSFTQADMCRLPVASNSVDVVTGSYALRNAGDLNEALAEIGRVMKPGGIGIFLDFNKLPGSIPSCLQYVLIKFWGSLWGTLLHLNPSVHGYIADSLKQFPSGPDLIELFRRHKMQLANDKILALGAIRLWAVRKL